MNCSPALPRLNSSRLRPDTRPNAVARNAITRKTGARGLRSILEGILLETMFELPTFEGVEEVVVNAEVIECKAQPLLIYSGTRSRKAAPDSAT